MKLYIDLSCDKVSGQQHMQRALRDYCIEQNIYADKLDADILVYVQVPFDENIIDEWKTLKAQGKKIVFIHHYMSKSFYERCAIFKINGLFELIDKHVCISKTCELYDYLISRGIDKTNIFTTELAASNYDMLYHNYFKSVNEKLPNSIIFAGKVIKGLDRFVDYCSTHKFNHKTILCPDVHKYEGDLSDFTVYSDKKFSEVYEEFAKHMYLYCPSVYNTPKMHLETVMQEAIPCGCVPLTDHSYLDIIDNFDTSGFVLDSEYPLSRNDYAIHQCDAISFQQKNYLTLEKTLKNIIQFCLSVI